MNSAPSSDRSPNPNSQGRTPEAAPCPDIIPGDWASAPKIIKGWAWQVAIIGSLLLPFYIYFLVNTGKSFVSLVINAHILVWLANLFMVYGVRQGVRRAWFIQIGVSVLSLVYCPVGTLLHGYLLSQWFKPEVKAWFDVR